jgi:hypothetical protein
MLPNFSRLRIKTGGFYNLTPNEADQLIHQEGGAARDPVSFDEFFSVFRVALPNSDGTLRYRFYRADVLWRSIKAVYSQNNALVYPEVQAPVWYEDWHELHNQYDPSGLVPPEVNQLLRFADYNPAAPPAWALPTPAPVPELADDDSDSHSDTEVPLVMNGLARETRPYAGESSNMADWGHVDDEGLGERFPVDGTEEEKFAYMWGQEVIRAGFRDPMTDAPVPRSGATVLDQNQTQVVDNILHNLRTAIGRHLRQRGEASRSSLMAKLQRGLIFKLVGRLYLASFTGPRALWIEVLKQLMAAFDRLEPDLKAQAVLFLSNYVTVEHNGEPSGYLGLVLPDEDLLVFIRGPLDAWEDTSGHAVHQSSDFELRMAANLVNLRGRFWNPNRWGPAFPITVDRLVEPWREVTRRARQLNRIPTPDVPMPVRGTALSRNQCAVMTTVLKDIREGLDALTYHNHHNFTVQRLHMLQAALFREFGAEYLESYAGPSNPKLVISETATKMMATFLSIYGTARNDYTLMRALVVYLSFFVERQTRADGSTQYLELMGQYNTAQQSTKAAFLQVLPTWYTTIDPHDEQARGAHLQDAVLALLKELPEAEVVSPARRRQRLHGRSFAPQ